MRAPSWKRPRGYISSVPGEADNLEVLVIAPVGRDSTLISDALKTVSIRAIANRTVEQSISLLNQRDLGAVLITEEVLGADQILMLAKELAMQEAWSDLPVLILTIGGSSTALSRKREQDRLPLGTVTLLERPIRMATLVSSVQSALRSRARQYQVRQMLIERDRAEAAQRESESRLLLAIETARLGTWERNITKGSLEASPTCRRIFDWPQGKLLTSQDLMDRVHPEDRDFLSGKVAEAIESQIPYTAEYRVVWSNGTIRWVSSSGRLLAGNTDKSPISAASSEVRLAGVTLDITERVLSEIALRNADKLALVGRLSSSIAHEINNPLEAVTNLLFLLQAADLNPTAKQYVSTAQRELARVSEIAAQTLTFNRQRDSHSEAKLTDILDSVLALYQGRLATSNIQVLRKYSFRRPILCYPGELRQVFTNLVANAFDATRKGGRIVVRERSSRHPVSNTPGIRITIADTGSGMSESVRARIFEAFYSTKGNNGTGLGLWISKGIVEKHFGSLRFKSSTTPGYSGTVFSIFLPILANPKS